MATNGVYPKSQVLDFQPNSPVTVAVKYAQPKLLAPKFPGGDERAMFSLTDGRLMFLDAEDARQITQLGIRPGQPFTIEMKWSGRRGDPKIYHVLKANGAPNYGSQNDGTFAVPSNGQPSQAKMARDTAANLEAQLAASIKAVEENKARLEEERKRAEAALTAPAPGSTQRVNTNAFHPTSPLALSAWGEHVRDRAQANLEIYWELVNWAQSQFPGITKNEIRCFLMNAMISAERNGGPR